ncbi:MAG: ATP-binding protein [Betaproteobacteria bacterium]|nr:MAG: ATP-binding protein [Betaproteobacteria bacterium]
MDASDDWLPRRIMDRIAEAMADTPVVCLLGPRQSGKSSLVKRAFPKRTYYSFDDTGLQATAQHDPAGFVASLPESVTLDEVHRVPEVLPAIKMAVDENRRPGRFLLTGSANLLLLPSVSESLAGRIEIVRLHPLTEAEKERKPGRLVVNFLEGNIRARIGPSAPDASDLINRILRGGYPEAMRRPNMTRVRQWHREYLDALIEKDARDVANLRNLDHLSRLMTLLSTQTATLLAIETVAKHLAIRRETVQNNLAALERLFLVRRLPAWHVNEARRLVKAPKVHVVDSGLAATLSELQAEDWTKRRDRFSHLVESFVVQQLIAQAQWTDSNPQFWHYRDRNKFEVDVVMTRGRKTWGVEVKASAKVTPADGAGLRRLAEQCGKDFQGGMILYVGASTIRTVDPRTMAVPISELWTS